MAAKYLLGFIFKLVNNYWDLFFDAQVNSSNFYSSDLSSCHLRPMKR